MRSAAAGGRRRLERLARVDAEGGGVLRLLLWRALARVGLERDVAQEALDGVEHRPLQTAHLGVTRILHQHRAHLNSWEVRTLLEELQVVLRERRDPRRA